MSKRNPSTSDDAFAQVTYEMLCAHYKKIVHGLMALGTAISEKIAEYTGMEKNQVSRRMKELEGMEIVYKPGTVALTKAKRKAENYCLTGKGLPKTDNEIKQVKEKLALPVKPVFAKPLRLFE